MRCGGKRTKYEAPCQANDIAFRPAVMEVFGAMSPHMEGLIKECAKLIDDSLPEDTSPPGQQQVSLRSISSGYLSPSREATPRRFGFEPHATIMPPDSQLV